MQTVKASVILDDAYRLMRWDTTQLETSEKQDGRMALSQALQEVWEAWWWSWLMQCTQLALATTYPATFNGVGQTFYWPQTDWYYSAFLRQGTFVLPNGPVAGDYAIGIAPIANVQYIGEGNLVEGVDYSVNRTAGIVTIIADVQSDFIFNISFDYAYNSSDPTDAAGTTNLGWTKVVESPRLDAWSSTGVYAAGAQVAWKTLNYESVVADNLGNEPSSSSASWKVVPDWHPLIPVTNPDGTVTVPYGKVRSVSQLDPRATGNPGEFQFEEMDTGTRVIGLDVGRPWIWSRRVTPILTGDDFDAAASYEAAAAQDLVFDS